LHFVSERGKVRLGCGDVEKETQAVLKGSTMASKDDCERAYEKGYITGANAGYGKGNRDGYKEGYEKGFHEGYQRGRDAGYKKGYEAARERILKSPQDFPEELSE
jgi:flagellar biosynthesis/type III secretory pathway protein FliH